jgi:hypothetical protein
LSQKRPKISISLKALAIISLTIVSFLLLNPAVDSHAYVSFQQKQVWSDFVSHLTTRQTGTNPFWYVGAASTSPFAESNQGVRSSIEVENQSVSDGDLSFWVSEAFSNNLWAQVGYYVHSGNSSPFAFYQVWNLTDRTILAASNEPLSDGVHTFAIGLTVGNEWNFSVDDSSFGSFDMKTDISSSSYPMYAMSEEGYSPAPFPFNSVLFTSALQVFKYGSWQPVKYADSFGDNWGVQGHDQNGGLADNQVWLGWSKPTLPHDSTLWIQ